MNFRAAYKKRTQQLLKGLGLLAASLLVLAASPAYALLAGAYQYPVDWSAGKVTYPFASQAGPNSYHLADDAIADSGTPVYAPANCTVTRLENWPDIGNYGGLVLCQADNADGSSVILLHGHLDGSRLAVSVGQAVQRGQLLGYIGTSEQNGGWVPHVHFGISKGPYVQSPWKYWGYGPQSMLAAWENPTPYVAARVKVIEVKRVPDNSPDRYATAVGASVTRFPTPQSATSVLLASGTNFVDALSATALVKNFNASLLLTRPDALPDATKAELTRVLKPGQLVIALGGPKAISDAVLKQVAALGFGTQRIDGHNRAATAAGVANLLPPAPARALIVNDAAYPDAVSAGAPAASIGLPILLTKQSALSAETRTYFAQHPNVTTATIIGGDSVVAPSVGDELRTIPTIKNVERLAGADRYLTNVDTAEYLIGSPKTLVLATGTSFADALAGGALAGAQGGALVLTKPGALPDAAAIYVSPLRANVTIGYVLGGSMAVNPGVDKSLALLLNQPLAGAPSTASVSAEGTAADADAAAWSSAVVQSFKGLSVPVPSGYTLATQSFRGASVALVEHPSDQAAEIPAALAVSKVPVPVGSTAAASVAAWFGLAPGSVTSANVGLVPGFAPTYTQYVDHGAYVVIVEARGGDGAAVAAHVAAHN